MKRICYAALLVMILINLCQGQGIRISEDQLPPDESAILDIQSTDKGDINTPEHNTETSATPQMACWSTILIRTLFGFTTVVPG